MLIVEVKDNQLTDILFPDEHSDTSAIKPVVIPGMASLRSFYLVRCTKIEMKGAPEKCISGSKPKVRNHPMQNQRNARENLKTASV